MKILESANYFKIAKDKAEDFDVNPWAVCHTTTDKDENPEKYERCVQKVKQKHRKKSSDEWLRVLEAKEDEKWIQDAVKNQDLLQIIAGGRLLMSVSKEAKIALRRKLNREQS